MPLDRTRLLDAYRVMRTIRTVEQTLHELSLAGRVPGFLHLYAGEEAVAAGVCAHLGAVDTVTSTHRGHGHAIARGIDLGAMMAELFGRRDGVCRGKGGTMHVADTEKGMLGANGIVGGGIPLAVGAALSAKVRRTGGVAVAFFAVHAAAGEATLRARRGEGPTLLECKTYRYFGHYVGDPLTYRPKEEAERIRTTRDPLDAFERRVLAERWLAADDLRRIDAEVAAAVEAAVRYAEASPPPDPADVTRDVYVHYARAEEG